MKRIGRWAFNMLAAVSLVLFVATTAVWGRAIFWEDFVWWETETSAKSVLSLRYAGLLYVRVGATVDWPRPLLWSTRPSRPMGSGDEQGMQPSKEDVYHLVIGAVEVDRRPPDGRVRGGTAYIVVVVYPLVTLASAILPARWWLNRRRELALRREGCCTRCGYDLRATPDRCPECGTDQPSQLSREVAAPSAPP